MIGFLLKAFIYGFILGVVLDLFVKPHFKSEKSFKRFSLISDIVMIMWLLF